MEIKNIVVGPLQTNCYLLSDSDSGDGIIIDPGADAGPIAETCAKLGIKPLLIVNTHAHFDHIGANRELKDRFPGLKIAAGALDAESLSDPTQNLTAGFGVQGKMPSAEIALKEGDRVDFGHCSLLVRHTPGHSIGSITLAAEKESPVPVFCGDLLFADGVGRTDLPGGDRHQLENSIRDVLSAYGDDAVLYPGHGPSITVGERKKLGW